MLFRCLSHLRKIIIRDRSKSKTKDKPGIQVVLRQRYKNISLFQSEFSR